MNRLLSVLVVSIVLGGLSFFVARKVVGDPKPNLRRAFTATIYEQHYKDGGVYTRSELDTRAIRSDGSEVDIYDRRDPEGKPMQWKRIVDLGSGRRTIVEPVTKSIMSSALSGAELRHFMGVSHPCKVPSDAPRDKILGYEVARVQVQGREPGPVFQLERWEAPALDCFPLREIFKLGSGDDSSPYTTREVVKVVEGEPDASLFEVPSEYRERSPSEVDELFAQRFPGVRPFEDKE